MEEAGTSAAAEAAAEATAAAAAAAAKAAGKGAAGAGAGAAGGRRRITRASKRRQNGGDPEMVAMEEAAGFWQCRWVRLAPVQELLCQALCCAACYSQQVCCSEFPVALADRMLLGSAPLQALHICQR